MLLPLIYNSLIFKENFSGTGIACLAVSHQHLAVSEDKNAVIHVKNLFNC